MKLYIMKREALEMLKANLPTIYGKYYTEKTNHWISDIYAGSLCLFVLYQLFQMGCHWRYGICRDQ